MNFFTHIEIAKILYKNLKRIMELDKKAFIYGNIKPDLTCKLLRNPHTLENYFLVVCRSAEDLISDELPLQEYSFELGEICHYVCDFFCQYHLNEEIFHRFKEHFIYELKLHFELRKSSPNIAIKPGPNKAVYNIPLIITEFRKDYSANPASMKKDIEFSLSAAQLVCESVAYFSSYSANAGNNEIDDACLTLHTVGGR